MPRFKVLDDGQFLELMTDVSDGQFLASKCPESIASCCWGLQKCGAVIRKSRVHLHMSLFWVPSASSVRVGMKVDTVRSSETGAMCQQPDVNCGSPFFPQERMASYLDQRFATCFAPKGHSGKVLVLIGLSDVWTEARRRWPEFKADEAHAKVPARDSRDQSEGDQGVDMVDLNDLQSSVAPSSAMQHLHPSSTRHAHESRGYRSEGSASDEETALLADEEQTKPGWLEAAEAKVKAHLGPGRSSHDFAHADRVRRQALGLARLQQSKSESVDARVVELAALFICAANDPKRPIHDPKELVLQFRAEHRDCLDQEQLEAVIRITRATGLKKEERRKRERRESDWHRTCLELHCVQDADKLEMLGAFGVLRTTATYGTTHRPLFEPSHEQTDAAGRAPGSAVKHLLEVSMLPDSSCWMLL